MLSSTSRLLISTLRAHVVRPIYHHFDFVVNGFHDLGAKRKRRGLSMPGMNSVLLLFVGDGTEAMAHAVDSNKAFGHFSGFF